MLTGTDGILNPIQLSSCSMSLQHLRFSELKYQKCLEYCLIGVFVIVWTALDMKLIDKWNQNKFCTIRKILKICLCNLFRLQNIIFSRAIVLEDKAGSDFLSLTLNYRPTLWTWACHWGHNPNSVSSEHTGLVDRHPAWGDGLLSPALQWHLCSPTRRKAVCHS